MSVYFWQNVTLHAGYLVQVRSTHNNQIKKEEWLRHFPMIKGVKSAFGRELPFVALNSGN